MIVVARRSLLWEVSPWRREAYLWQKDTHACVEGILAPSSYLCSTSIMVFRTQKQYEASMMYWCAGLQAPATSPSSFCWVPNPFLDVPLGWLEYPGAVDRDPEALVSINLSLHSHYDTTHYGPIFEVFLVFPSHFISCMFMSHDDINIAVEIGL